MSFEKISVIGLGYIGLPTAAVLASRKTEVVGVDVNEHTVEVINKGKVHIVEPDLDMMVQAAVTEGFLRATVTPEPADAFLIAVPTPFKDGYQPDTSYIKTACESIATVLRKGNIVILESTSPVGTTEEMARWLAALRPDLCFPLLCEDTPDVFLAYCPERVLPGHVLRELVENDRVIGGITPECSARAIELYKKFVKADCIVTNARTAEMAKLSENSFRDVNIAFANELSLICDKLNINVWELIALANRHPRVNILRPGPGVGGHCIAVDPWFIVATNPDETRLIKTAREVNESKPRWTVEKVKLAVADFLQEHSDKTTRDVTVGCYGLAFKPDIDDLRESPAIGIVEEISKWHDGRVLVAEPNISECPECFSNNVQFVESIHLKNKADIIVLLVAHRECKEVFGASQNQTSVIDVCGALVARQERKERSIIDQNQSNVIDVPMSVVA